ncbi:hypothetical protein CPC698_1318 [Chlamydia psittaci C6/98]|nr:hypothetical protein CPC698_1318 [Chlamydia psittaci C6/98]
MSRSKPVRAGHNRFEQVCSGLNRSKPVCGPVLGGLGRFGPV